MNIEDILKPNYMQDLIRYTCGEQTELVVRPTSYIIRNIVEEGNVVERLIILPPKGYTADQIDLMNSHDEAEHATIEIKGAVRPDKAGFSALKKCILIASIHQNGAVSDLNKPYLSFQLEGDKNPDLLINTHSAGDPPFAVVKVDGYGFYHNIINLSDDWIVMKLYKKLRPSRPVNLEDFMSGLLKGEASTLQSLYDKITLDGDGIFKSQVALINNVVRIPPSKSLPALCEMLYTHDSGKHEACSVFAVILKIAKMYPEMVTSYLQDAIKKGTVPAYYAQQLLEKIRKLGAQQSKIQTEAKAG